MKPSQKIKLRTAKPIWWAVHLTIDIHHATHGDSHYIGGLIVSIRARLPEGGDRSHNSSRIDLLKPRISQAEAFHVSRLERLHHEVSGFNKPLENLYALISLQI